MSVAFISGILDLLPHTSGMVSLGLFQGLCQGQCQGAVRGTALLQTFFVFCSISLFFMLLCCGTKLLLLLNFKMVDRSRDSSEVENPGNNLYVTGLSPRITKRELEKHFSGEGTVCLIYVYCISFGSLGLKFKWCCVLTMTFQHF